MKIYINRKPKIGPWGGGIKTVNLLVEVLRRKGHEVCFELENNIDIIFCVDPRPNHRGEWYQSFLEYKNKSQNRRVKIIQRVGDLGTHGKPDLTNLVNQTIRLSDFLIFPSEWSLNFVSPVATKLKIIHNAPMPVFYSNRKKDIHIKRKPRLITHHWSTNPKKGFSFYKLLEEHIDLFQDFEFNYIGRLPEGFMLKNYQEPMDAVSLSKTLPEYDIYISASEEEAGANHVLEAMASGLPVVYHRNGGSIEDYCKNSGESFETLDEMIQSINSVIKKYSEYKKSVLNYDNTNESVVKQYIDIIENL